MQVQVMKLPPPWWSGGTQQEGPGFNPSSVWRLHTVHHLQVGFLQVLQFLPFQKHAC